MPTPGKLSSLERRFHQLQDPRATSHVDGARASWVDIQTRLTSNAFCVVILGPAGSGKTTELQQLSKLENHHFLDIEEMVHLDPGVLLKTTIGLDSNPLYLLDGADQSVRHNPKGLTIALARLRAFQSVHGPARYIITSRNRDWDVLTDPERLRAALDLQPNQQILYYRLNPLSNSDVRRIAEDNGIADVDQFLHRLRSVGGASVVLWPLQAVQAAREWRDTGKLGLPHERLHRSILDGCGDHHPAPAMPSREDAYSALQTLAACIAFGVSPSIATSSASHPQMIDPHVVLPTWRPELIPWLLGSALFGSASVDAVRFQRLESVDYLAAKWLDRRTRSASLDPADLLFVPLPDCVQVPPGRRAIAAWVAIENTAVRQRLTEHDPGALLFHGAPYLLPRSTLSKCLTNWIHQHDSQLRPDNWLTPTAIASLAHAPIEQEIAIVLRTACSTPGTSELVFQLLLGLAESGLLTQASSELVAIAIDPTRSLETRASAIEATASAPPHIVRKIAERILPTPPPELISSLVRVAFPDQLSTNQVLALVAQMVGADLAADASLVSAVSNRAPERSLWRLARGLHTIAHFYSRTRSRGGRICNKKHLWVARLLEEVVSRLVIRRQPIPPRLMPILLDALSFLERSAEHRYDLPLDSLATALSQATINLREILLTDAIVRNKKRLFAWVQSSRSWRFKPADTPWLSPFLKKHIPNAEEFVAVHLLCRLYLEGGSDSSHRAAILASFPAALATMNPPTSAGRSARRQAAKDRLAKIRRIRCLACNAHALENGHLGLLCQLANQPWFAQLGFSSDRFEYSRERVVAYLGNTVAELLLRGIRDVWSTFAPLGPTPTKVNPLGVVGLLSAQVWFAEGGRPEDVSPSEAALLFRHAAHSLNRYPSWVSHLATIHPSVARKWIRREISRDWTTTPQSIRLLSGAGPRLIEMASDEIIELIRTANPSSPEVSAHAASILLASERSNECIADALATVCDRYDLPDDIGALIPVLTGCLITDPEATSSWIDSRPGSCPSELATGVAARMSNDLLRGTLDSREARSFSHISRLLPFVRLLLSRITAPNRPANTVYSSTDADEAEYYRTHILNSISKNGTETATQLFDHLMQSSSLSSWHEELSFYRAAQLRSRASLESLTLTPDDILSIERCDVRLPSDDRELFTLLTRHIALIVDRVQSGDHSYRSLVHPHAEESAVAEWMADQLDFRWGTVYSVVREAEVLDSKRTDISVHIPGIPRVTIELKRLAKNQYTIPALEHAIEDQLVGRYMRDGQAKHGIFVLAQTERRSQGWVEPTTGSVVQYDRLLILLQNYASKIVATNPAVAAISVVGIDFT